MERVYRETISAPVTPPYDHHGRRRSSSVLPSSPQSAPNTPTELTKPSPFAPTSHPRTRTPTPALTPIATNQNQMHIQNEMQLQAHARPLMPSPPPTPKTPKTFRHHRQISSTAAARLDHQRLRSGSGLLLHTNEDAVRAYTDYNADGSSRSPLFRTVDWHPARTAQQQQQQQANSEIVKVGFRHSGSTITSTAGSSWGGSELGTDFPEFLGRKIFGLAQEEPAVSRRLFKFAQRMGCSQDIAFLLKVREYAASVDRLTSLVASISTDFTSCTATTPIDLPPQTSRSLDADIKHVSGVIMPGMDSMFLEARTCVERRVGWDIFPAFVKSQLAFTMTRCLSMDLPLRPRPWAYPGLGTSFCVTEGNLYEYASDDFIRLTGYQRERIIHQNARILQGPMTDLADVSRILDQLAKQEESVDLLINHREDGRPFWNLLYICPLRSPFGETRRYLHAYINISEGLAGTRDVLRILGYEPEAMDAASVGVPADRESVKSKASRKGFFKFGRRTPTEENFPWSVREGRNTYIPTPPTPTPPPSTASSSLWERPLPPLPPVPEREDIMALQTVYRRFILLKHHPGPKTAKLLICHASRSALDILNLSLAADAIRNEDIFEVLADHAHCPSITKSFKSAVKDSLIVEGRHKALELVIKAPDSSRKGSMAGGPVPEWVEEVGDGRGKAGRGKLVQLNSFWTPLKDWKGRPVMSILVLVPTAGSGVY